MVTEVTEDRVVTLNPEVLLNHEDGGSMALRNVVNHQSTQHDALEEERL